MSHAVLFEHFRDARLRKAPPWAAPLFAGCALFTAALLFGMWAKGIWETEQLERPKLSVDLAIAPAPPPPPPPLAGGEKPAVTPPMHPKLPTVRELVQPPRIEKEVPKQAAENPGDPNGKAEGVPGGTGHNIFAPITSDAPPQPREDKRDDVPKARPIVPPNALEASRISGDKLIEPDDVTKTEIQRAGRDHLSGTFKLCLSSAGTIESVAILKPTGFAAYDRKIESTIASTWRYRPFLVDNKPTPVCTAVTFKYSQ
jgi:hypothetical protein